MIERYSIISEVDEERMGDESILLHRKTLTVKVLNETATILWDALPQFPTVDALVSLLVQAYPDEPSPGIYKTCVTDFLEELTSEGFLVREEKSAP